MAYLTFEEIGGTTTDRPPAAPAPLPAPLPPVGEDEVTGRLGPLEWSVVALARRDRPSSFGEPGRIATAMRSLFGARNPKLADPRLEALRRMAVLTWRDGYAVSPYEVQHFLAAGFSTRQYETVADSIGVARQRPPRTVAA